MFAIFRRSIVAAARKQVPQCTFATKLDKVLYTAHTHTVGGREGTAKTADGKHAVTFTAPTGTGVNPEQLFGMGYSACFLGAVRAAGNNMKVKIPDNASVDASVDLGPIPNGYGIAVKLEVTLPGLDKKQAKDIVDAAHIICPYSNATRNNVVVDLIVK